MESDTLLGDWNANWENEFSGIWKRELNLKEILRAKPEGKSKFKIEIRNALGTKENGGAKLGEELFLEILVRSEEKESCFFSLLHFDPLGNVTQLFPNKFSPDGKVMTNQEFRFPSLDLPKKYKLIASEPIGDDTLVLLASELPISFASKQVSGIYQTSSNANSVTKGIKRQLALRTFDFTSKRIVLEVHE